PSTKWHNSYREPFEQHLLLGVSVFCIVILVVCLLCYVSITKIKKEWWDQIPNPARSRLVAIIIQDAQGSQWEKRSRGPWAPRLVNELLAAPSTASAADCPCCNCPRHVLPTRSPWPT
ncbi:IL4R isoform 16, partial [Pan troglodytes]